MVTYARGLAQLGNVDSEGTMSWGHGTGNDMKQHRLA